MNVRRVLTLAGRVMRQVLRDRRTLALLVIAPMIVLLLGALLFRAEPAVMSLGVVNEDRGLSNPLVGKVFLAERIVAELETSEFLEVVPLRREEMDDRLRDGTVLAVVIFSEDFSAGFRQSQQVTMTLRLEGSNPSQSVAIRARVAEAGIKALAGIASAGLGLPGAPEGPVGEARPPIVVTATYLFAGAEFDTMDFIAPVYVGLLVMFFVFLLTCVSFIRERSQGTMERLLATPANRLEIVLGYMAGLGLFALLQVTVIVLFTVWVVRIHYLGSLAMLFVVVALLAVVGVSMGILASAFAHNEFQVVQFIPLLIIPQALLSGVFWAVEEMPTYLQPLAYAMPLTYANRALRDVMLKGYGLVQIWPDLAVLLGFAALLVILGTLTMRREVA